MIKKIIAVCTVLLIVFSNAAFAYEPMSYINVGLDFNTASVDSFESYVDHTTVIGYVENKQFTKMSTLAGGYVKVEKGGGAYAMTSDTYPLLDDALIASKALRNDGVYAYGGYVDGYFRVLVGLYGSLAEAEDGANQLEAIYDMDFEAVSLDTKAVMAEANYYYMVFRDENKMFAFGATGGGTASYKNRTYRGYMVADRLHTSGIQVINLVSMDDYLASVVASEMVSSWHIEALKAQALAARTYACTVTRYQKYGVDVTDDTYTQAYTGTKSETDSTRRAASETSGQIVMYNGKPADTYFSASSGGLTADVYSVWGGGEGLDYLRSVPDPYEDTENIPSGVWTYTFTPEELKGILAEKGIDIGNITNVYAAERGETDKRVIKLIFVGTNGEHSVTFESTRTFLGLKSQYYYIDSPKSSSLSAVSANGACSVDAAASFVLSADGLTSLSAQNVNAINAEGTLASVSVSYSDGVYTFSGRGNGNCVGMSQWGAKGMAEAGFTCYQIIEHYYPGTNINK